MPDVDQSVRGVRQMGVRDNKRVGYGRETSGEPSVSSGTGGRGSELRALEFHRQGSMRGHATETQR